MPEAAAETETETDAPASVAAVPETGRRPAGPTAKVPANLAMDLVLPTMEPATERSGDTTPAAADAATRGSPAAAVRPAQGAGPEHRPLPAMAAASAPAVAAGVAPSPRTASSRAVSPPVSTRRTTAPSHPDPRRQDIAARRDPPAPTPEVHIHIGRIELSAVNPPPAGKREARPPAKPMTLDEYLGRRGGGGR